MPPRAPATTPAPTRTRRGSARSPSPRPPRRTGSRPPPGRPPDVGPPPTAADVPGRDSAVVTVTVRFVPPPPVQHPAISIVKNPDSQTVSMGGTAAFRITVTIPGDVTLLDVTVPHPLSP